MTREYFRCLRWLAALSAIAAVVGCGDDATAGGTEFATGDEAPGSVTGDAASTSGTSPSTDPAGVDATSGTDAESGADTDTVSGSSTDTGTGSGDDSGEPEPEPKPVCADENVLCVDDDAGDTQEYSSIQAAVDDTLPGDTVFVHEGVYAGFRVSDSGTDSERIEIWGQPGALLQGTEPGGTNNAVRFEAVSYVTVRGFRIARDGTRMAYDYDNSCMAARGTTVDNPMRGLTIRDNELAGCSPAGLYVSQTEGLTLENNYIHDVVQSTQGNAGQGIYLSNAGTDNVTLRSNTIADNEGPGIHMNGDSSIGGDGLQTGHVFDGNVISGNGINGFNMDGVQDSLIVNNVFARNGRHAVRGFRIDADQGPANIVIVNNTFIENGDTATRFTEDAGGHILFNNLVVDNSANIFDIAQSDPQTAGNMFLDSGAGVFEDSEGGDFRITASSGAVDLGVDALGGQMAPSDDLNGFAREGAPDVGAFELGSEG